METLIWMLLAGVLVFAGLMISRENVRLGISLVAVAIAYVALILLVPRIMDR